MSTYYGGDTIPTIDDLRQAAAADAALSSHERQHNSPLNAMIRDDQPVTMRMTDDVHRLTGIYVTQDAPTEHLPAKMRSTVRRWAIREGVKLPEGGLHLTHEDGRICGRRNDTRWVFLPDPPGFAEVCDREHVVKMRARYTVTTEVEVLVEYDDNALHMIAQHRGGDLDESILDEHAGEYSHMLATDYLNTLDTHGPVYVRGDLDGVGADTVERVSD